MINHDNFFFFFEQAKMRYNNTDTVIVTAQDVPNNHKNVRVQTNNNYFLI